MHKLSQSLVELPSSVTSLSFPFIAEMQKFSKWEKGEEKVKLEPLAGPEAALQTKHTLLHFCIGSRRRHTEKINASLWNTEKWV